MIENKECCFCKNKNLKHAHRDILRCDKCGLFIKSKMPDKKALKLKLKNKLLSACKRPGGPQRRMRNADLHTLDILEEYISPGVLFDVGCASGFVIKAAQNRGWEAHGNDISVAAVKWAKEKYDLDIHYEFFEDINLKNNYYDAVILWNSLEHTHNPEETLSFSKKILKPGGMICIRIPEKASIEELTKYYENEHFYEFNIEILKNYFKLQGFEKKKIVKNWRKDGPSTTDYFYKLIS